MPIPSAGGFGAVCFGAATSSGVEMKQQILTRPSSTQHSRWIAYIEAQPANASRLAHDYCAPQVGAKAVFSIQVALEYLTYS